MRVMALWNGSMRLRSGANPRAGPRGQRLVRERGPDTRPAMPYCVAVPLHGVHWKQETTCERPAYI